MKLADARQRLLSHADGLQANGGTAIYAALQRAQALARDELQREPGRYISIVLLSDGENTSGPGFAQFRQGQASGTAVRVFPVIFGEAPSDEMVELANLTGGPMPAAGRCRPGCYWRSTATPTSLVALWRCSAPSCCLPASSPQAGC